jgi:hypothetical protein
MANGNIAGMAPVTYRQNGSIVRQAWAALDAPRRGSSIHGGKMTAGTEGRRNPEQILIDQQLFISAWRRAVTARHSLEAQREIRENLYLVKGSLERLMGLGSGVADCGAAFMLSTDELVGQLEALVRQAEARLSAEIEAHRARREAGEIPATVSSLDGIRDDAHLAKLRAKGVLPRV